MEIQVVVFIGHISVAGLTRIQGSKPSFLIIESQPAELENENLRRKNNKSFFFLRKEKKQLNVFDSITKVIWNWNLFTDLMESIVKTTDN